MPAENAVKTTSKKSPPKKPTSQLSPRPTRKPRRTIQEEREIIQKIINELFTRKKEQETIEAKAQGLLSTEKEKQRKERIVKSRESAKKYLAQNKDKAIQIKSKVSRKSKSPKKN
jgi:RecB family exonuclease